MIKSLAVPPKFKLKLAALALASLGLAGCGGTLSGAGPYKGDIETKNESYNLVEINANTIGPYMRGAVRPVQASIAKPVAPSARLMAGDILNVLITDNAPEGSALFAPLSSGGTQLNTPNPPTSHTIASAGL